MPFYAPLCESSSDYAITQAADPDPACWRVGVALPMHMPIRSHSHSQVVCLTNGAEVHHQLLRLMNINLPWADRAPSLCLLFLISFFLEGSPVVARAIAGELRCLGDLTTDAANK